MENKNKTLKLVLSILAISAILLGNVAMIAHAADAPPSLGDFEFPDEADQPDDNDGPPSLGDANIPAEANQPADEASQPGQNDDNNDDNDNEDVSIRDAEAFPKGFNPSVADTTISYELTAEAIVEVTILNRTGSTILTLVNDQTQDAGKHSIKWTGTTNNRSTGQVVPSGRYEYKIAAKDPDTEAVKDTARGDINIIYASQSSNQTSSQTSSTTSSTNADAMMAMQNAQSGQTAGTGPGVLAYFLFPAFGYIISKKKF